MRQYSSLIISAMLSASLWVTGAHAQGNAGGQKDDKDTPPTVNPYRPTVTDPATLTVPGYLEMEIGGQDVHRGQSQTGGGAVRRQFYTPATLKLTDRSGRLEYHLTFEGTVTLKDDQGQSLSGIGDTIPGLQYLLLKQTPKTYDVAVRAEYKVPTSKSGIGTGKSDYDVLLLASKDYSKTYHVDFDLGYFALGRASGTGFASQYQASGVLNTKLSNTLTLQDEIYGFSGSSENSTIISTLHALGYQPSHTIAYDIGVDFGISHAAPKYTVLFGSTFFLGKLF